MADRKPIGRRTSGGRRTLWLLVGAAALATLLGVVHTWTRIAVLDRLYGVSRLRAENERLSHEREKLRLEVATLEGTIRVSHEASEKLGMARPEPARVVHVAPAPVPAVARNERP